MPKILVIHGAGMEMRGKTHVDVFGPMTLADYDAEIGASAAQLGIEVVTFQSNNEAEVVDRLQAAVLQGFDAVIINPAGFTRGYPALNGAIARVGVPIIEVHVSNPAARGLASEVLAASSGGISGFGIAGYALALRGLADRIQM